MYIYLLYLVTIIFLICSAIKANKHKQEWLLLLIMLSFIKTCIMYLFEATTVFTVMAVGSTQIHLDDIILIITLLYCIWNIIQPIQSNKYMMYTLLILFPVCISIIRGVMTGTIGTATFLADTRTFVIFVTALYSFYFVFRKPIAVRRLWKCKQYVERLMNVLLGYVLIVWILDLVFGMNNLPGQVGGTLSDGGSTFRIIHPGQVVILAFYTLYKMYNDLCKKKLISFRTLLFTVVILLLQWRTVVAAYLVGVLVLLAYPIRNNRISKKLFGEIVALIVLVIVLIFQGKQSNGLLGMLENLFESFKSIGEGTGTFSTRIYAWGLILSSLTGINAVFGRPFGQNLGISWTASAHSGYVDYIAKMGYAGIIALLIFMILLFMRTLKNKENLFSAVLITLFVYWIGYGFTIEQGAILGFMLAMLELKEKNRLNGELYEM